MLGNVSEKSFASITLSVVTSQVDAAFRELLVRLLKTYKGETPLKIYIIDPKLDYKIEFKSKKYKVHICTDLIDELDRLGFTYSLARKP